MTASSAGIFGFLLAYAVILGGLPGSLRAGAPDVLGRRLELRRRPAGPRLHLHPRALGLVTALLKTVFGINLYADGFTLYSKLGLEIVYLYFQFPLMVLIIAPAIDGLKREWREAAENMGALSAQYWRYVALPILTPTHPRDDDPAVRQRVRRAGDGLPADRRDASDRDARCIGAQIRGDVLHNVGLGYAMAMGMVVIMGVLDRPVPLAPAARSRAVAAMRRRPRASAGGLVVPASAVLYFFVPLVGTFIFSLGNPLGPPVRRPRSSSTATSCDATSRLGLLEQPRLLVRRRHRSRSS